MLTNVVDDTDVGMVECRCCSGFPLEPLQCLTILGKLLRQELQGHIATQAGILGLVDYAHPTATELFCDFVVGDGLADHGLVGGSEAFEFGEPVEDDADSVFI